MSFHQRVCMLYEYFPELSIVREQCRVVYLRPKNVQLASCFEVFVRIRRWIMLPVFSLPCGAKLVLGLFRHRSNVIFIVSPKGAGVVGHWLARVNVPGYVAVPEVAVDQARFDFMSIGLHWSEQSWNDLVKDLLQNILHFFGVWSLGLLF